MNCCNVLKLMNTISCRHRSKYTASACPCWLQTPAMTSATARSRWGAAPPVAPLRGGPVGRPSAEGHWARRHPPTSAQPGDTPSNDGDHLTTAFRGVTATFGGHNDDVLGLMEAAEVPPERLWPSLGNLGTGWSKQSRGRPGGAASWYWRTRLRWRSRVERLGAVASGGARARDGWLQHAVTGWRWC